MVFMIAPLAVAWSEVPMFPNCTFPEARGGRERRRRRSRRRRKGGRGGYKLELDCPPASVPSLALNLHSETTSGSPSNGVPARKERAHAILNAT